MRAVVSRSKSAAKRRPSARKKPALDLRTEDINAAMKRAAKAAAARARAAGTKLYVLRDGKIVAEDP